MPPLIEDQTAQVAQLLSDQALQTQMESYHIEEYEEGDAPPEPLDDSEVTNILAQEYNNSLGGESDDELSQARAQALNYYHGRPRGDEIAGRSHIQSLDVADMTEALLSQIMPLFAGTAIGQFEARAPEEMDQVRIESEYCNWVIMQKNHGYVVLQEAIKNALLLKNGVIKVYPDIKHTPKTEVYEGLNEEERMEALQPTTENEKVYVVAEDREELEITDNVEYLDPSQSRVSYNLIIRRVRTEKKLCVESIPLDEFSICADHNSPLMVDCRYSCHTRKLTRSQLLEMGYPEEKVNKLQADNSLESSTVEAIARRQYQKEFRSTSPQKATDAITVREHCVRMDYDQDGYAELRRIVTAGHDGGTILENEETPFVFFASGSGYLQPGRWVGLSVYDKQKEVQDQKTGFLRQYMDNMNYMNNRRLGVLENRVRYDEALASRPGGLIRMKQADAVFPIPVDDIGSSSIQALNYLDQVRTDRGGAALDMQQQQQSIPSDSAHGVERQVSAKEMMSAQITRNLCETLVRETFLLVHKSLREHFPEEAPIPMLVMQKMQQEAQMAQMQAQAAMAQRGGAAPPPAAPLQIPSAVTPGRWTERDNIILTTGLSQGEKIRQQQAMGAIINFQQQAKDSGDQGILVTPSAQYEAYIHFARASGVSTPELFWQNPSSPAAQDVSQKNAAAAQEMQAKQDEIQKLSLEAQITLAQAERDKVDAAREKNMMQAKIDSLRLMLQEAKDEADLAEKAANTEFDYDKLATDTAVKLLEMEQAGNTQLDTEYQDNRTMVRS